MSKKDEALILPLGKTRFDLEPETKLYTSPPATKPLTDAQFSKLCLRVAPRLHRTADAVELLKAIEASHGITGEQK